MNDRIDKLGIIAGNRALPLELARQARRLGVKELVAVAFEGETDPGLAALVDKIIWVKVGQLSKPIKAFHENGVRHCVMIGQVAPRNLFDIRPDLRAMGLLLRLKQKNAHTIFGAIADELKQEGIELVEPLPWLKALMPGAGFHFGPKLSAAERQDLDFGFRIAKEVSRLEIGQTVVVKKGAVLAVEGFEGTDQCLLRGGGLCGKDGGAVAVKVAKAHHDLRFDIPCLGPQTLETCAAARIAALGLESDKTLLLEQSTCQKLADKLKVAVATLG